MAAVKKSKQEQSEATRAALITAARKLFAEKGFAETGTEEIVASADVSRGALYHQFSDKRALFLAVFDQLEKETMERVEQAVAAQEDPMAMMHCGCEAFLDICREPEMRRIALLDAPSVVGWQTWREIDSKYSLGLIRGVLGLMADKGSLDPALVADLSHLVLGALSEAALVVGHSPDDAEARARVGSSVKWMIERLLGSDEKIAAHSTRGR